MYVCVLEAGTGPARTGQYSCTCRVLVVCVHVLLRQEEGPWEGGVWPAE